VQSTCLTTSAKNSKSSSQRAQDDQTQPEIRHSAKIKHHSQKKAGYEYRCDACNNGKIFDSLRGLKIHQSQSCVMSLQYKPKAFYMFTDAELDRIFIRTQTPNRMILTPCFQIMRIWSLSKLFLSQNMRNILFVGS